MNFYSGAPLDRMENRRRDRAWLEPQLNDAASRVLVLWRSRHLVAGEGEPLELSGAEAASFIAAGHQTVFLGQLEGRSLIALDLSEIDDPDALPSLTGRGRFQDLREFGANLPREDGAILAYARGLLYWHQRHRFCGVCGSPTQSLEAGHVRRCRNGSCDSLHFPRTDPAVIMLIHDDGEHCLLGRQKGWPPGLHSTLAGFVEPGESLEEAVAREVQEEVGLQLDVAAVRYHSSQPWPFPSSLMLGFSARAAREELRINPDELEAARWFSRAELRASPEDQEFRLPRRDSIARRLVEDWLSGRVSGLAS